MGAKDSVAHRGSDEVGLDVEIRREHRTGLTTDSYRVNVFGFPAAKGLTSQNVGLLDQRKA
jgi:hypothetical protein